MGSPELFFSVLIVNFNGGHFVQKALESLARQTFREFEVILVDNASTDGSIDHLDPAGLPAFQMMAERVNHGFAAGNNLAARHARGKWLALLNPDAEAEPDWLETLKRASERHPGVNCFASAQFALGVSGRLDGAGDNYLGWGFPWRGGYRRPTSELPAEGDCFSPCGASAVYRRQTFFDYGGFDERLFCFCEDVDLGFRMQLGGERCIFLPDAVVHHFGGGLSDKVSGFATRLGTRNRLWTYVKNMPLALMIPTLPLHVALTFVVLGRGVFTGRFLAVLAGLAEGLRRLPYGISGRSQVQKSRKISLLRLASIMDWNVLHMLGRRVYVKPLRRVER